MQKKSPAFTEFRGEFTPRLVKLQGGTDDAACHNSDVLSLHQVERYGSDWLYDCQYRQHSPRTIEFRRHVIEKLLWFLQRQGAVSCGTAELKQFLIYVTCGHEEPLGRWDNPRCLLNRRPVRPATLHRYYRELRTFFAWVVAEGWLKVSPVSRIAPPVARPDQIQPFAAEQLEALLHSARRSKYARRDEAILLLLLDTGMRASELCGLRMGHLDLFERRAAISGKGGKTRTVHFGRETGRALRAYLREGVQGLAGSWETMTPESPLFVSERGRGAGLALTRDGLRHLMTRLGRSAGLRAVRCSPHTFRHTFAVEFLRAGGNVFTLQQMLGHTTLAITQRYVALAQADIENQHRQFSPVERLKRKAPET